MYHTWYVVEEMVEDDDGGFEEIGLWLWLC